MTASRLSGLGRAVFLMTSLALSLRRPNLWGGARTSLGRLPHNPHPLTPTPSPHPHPLTSPSPRAATGSTSLPWQQLAIRCLSRSPRSVNGAGIPHRRHSPSRGTRPATGGSSDIIRLLLAFTMGGRRGLLNQPVADLRVRGSRSSSIVAETQGGAPRSSPGKF